MAESPLPKVGSTERTDAPDNREAAFGRFRAKAALEALWGTERGGAGAQVWYAPDKDRGLEEAGGGDMAEIFFRQG